MSSNQRSSLCYSTDYNINNIFILHSSMHKQCHIINFWSLHKNFQEDHLNSRRFPGGFSNSRFPWFPGVVDTLYKRDFMVHFIYWLHWKRSRHFHHFHILDPDLWPFSVKKYAAIEDCCTTSCWSLLEVNWATGRQTHSVAMLKAVPTQVVPEVANNSHICCVGTAPRAKPSVKICDWLTADCQ